MSGSSSDGGNWVTRLCKSGEVLYYYNAVTGEWRWPSKNDDRTHAQELCNNCVVKMEVDKDTLDQMVGLQLDTQSPMEGQISAHVMAHFTDYDSGDKATNAHADRVKLIVPRKCLTISRTDKPNTSTSSYCHHKSCQDTIPCESKNDLASPSVTNSDHSDAVKAPVESFASSEEDHCDQTRDYGSNPQPYIYFAGSNHTSFQGMETQCNIYNSTAETTNRESGTVVDGADDVSLSTGKLSERNNLSQPSRKHEQGASTCSVSAPSVSNSFVKDPIKQPNISKELSFVNYLSHIKETYLSELPPSSSGKFHVKVGQNRSMECNDPEAGFAANGKRVGESDVAPASNSSVSNKGSTCSEMLKNLVPEVKLKNYSPDLLLRPPPGLRSKVTTILQSSPLTKQSTLMPQVSANQSTNPAAELNQNLSQGRKSGSNAEDSQTSVLIQGDARISATLGVHPSQIPITSVEQQELITMSQSSSSCHNSVESNTEIENTVDKQPLKAGHEIPSAIKQSSQSSLNKITGSYPIHETTYNTSGKISRDANKQHQRHTNLSPAQEALSFLNYLSEFKDKPELAPVERQIVSGLTPVNNHLAKVPGVFLLPKQPQSPCSPQLPRNNAVTYSNLIGRNSSIVQSPCSPQLPQNNAVTCSNVIARHSNIVQSPCSPQLPQNNAATCSNLIARHSNTVNSPGTSNLRDDNRMSQVLPNVDKEKPTQVNQSVSSPAQFPGEKIANPNTGTHDSSNVQLPVGEITSQSIDHVTQVRNDKQGDTELTETANGRVSSKDDGGRNVTKSDKSNQRQVSMSEKRALSFLEYMILYKSQQDSSPNGVAPQQNLNNSTISSVNDVQKGEWVISRGKDPKVNVDWSKDYPFSCPECGKRFKRKQRVLVHCRFKKCKKAHKCRHCDKTFKKSDRLRIHERCHTGERPYKCQHCEKSFSSRKNLKTHTRVHTGEKPYKCIHCSKSFAQKSSQIRHLLTHTGAKPFSCKQCNKTFNQSSSLARHERLHTGEKPYQCKLCDKTFTQSFGLVLHTRTHTGEKPHVCTQCNKSFSRLNDMLKHKANHGENGTKKKKGKTLRRKQLSSSESSSESDFS